MSPFLSDNLPIIVIGLLILIVVIGMVVRPGQKISLTGDQAPERPHLAHSYNLGIDEGKAREGRGLVDEGAAALADVAGQMMQAHVHDALPGATGVPDDFTRMKGVGPKFAAMLGAKGFARFDQLAALSPEEASALSASLGSFAGRLERDRVVEQAAFLARGDETGYEATFGKL